MPQWYQMNPKVFLYNIAFPVQIYYVAGLSVKSNWLLTPTLKTCCNQTLTDDIL